MFGNCIKPIDICCINVMQRIAKIKLGFSGSKITDRIVEKFGENSLIFLLNLNNNLDLHKIK